MTVYSFSLTDHFYNRWPVFRVTQSLYCNKDKCYLNCLAVKLDYSRFSLSFARLYNNPDHFRWFRSIYASYWTIPKDKVHALKSNMDQNHMTILDRFGQSLHVTLCPTMGDLIKNSCRSGYIKLFSYVTLRYSLLPGSQLFTPTWEVVIEVLIARHVVTVYTTADRPVGVS